MSARKLLVLFLALGLVAGCAKPAPTPTAPTPGPVTAPTPTPRAPAPLATPVAVAAVKPTGELRIAQAYIGAEVMDPTLGPASGVKVPLAPLYDYLVGATLEGELSRETGLAENWEVSHSPNSSVYTFYIRKGVKFHNGEEVTAEDVKFSLEYFIRPASVSTRSGTLREMIGRIEVPERYKVMVHTKKPYGLLLAHLSRIDAAEGIVLPKKYIQEVGGEYFNKNPIGTGPYRFKEQVIGSYMRFEATGEAHWLYGVPKFKTLTFFLVPEETTRIAMLKVGQADIIDTSRERLKELGEFNVFRKPGGEVVGAWLGNQWQTDTYLYDKRVREALNLAINREEILTYIFGGQGQVMGHGIGYGTWAIGYKPLPLYPLDPERAKKLLSEAFPKGVELSINSFNRPGVSELMRVNEAVAGMWGKVGVKTKIFPMEYATHRAKQNRGDLPNTAAGMALSNQPFWVGPFRTLYHSKGLLTLVKEPAMDALIEEAEGEIDLSKIGERQYQIARYLRDNHIMVPLLEVDSVFVANRQKITRWNLGKLYLEYNFQDLWQRK